jgi:hypothetical protein
MKELLKKISMGLLLVPALTVGLSFVVPSTAHAACDTTNLSLSSGANCAQGNDTPTSLFGDGSDQGIFKTIVNIMLFLVGAVAVIMLIFGGIRYVTSGGAQDQVTAAKNTIMYAIIGIVVAILAFAVVNFVIGGLKTT